MDEYAKRSEERRHEYQRRWRQALKDGGRGPGDAEWGDLLGRARDVTRAGWARLTEHMQTSASDVMPSHGKEPLEFLYPGHVAVPASVVLGLEATLNDVLASREAIEQHRMALLGLVNRAQVLPAAGEPDLFKLEEMLENVRGGPTHIEKQLLEVVRELIRWRAAAQVPAVQGPPRSEA